MAAFSALMLNGFREARRNRVTLAVVFFAVLLLLGSAFLTEVTVSTFDRVLVDVGLGVMSLLMVLLAIFLSSGLLGREIERRTIFMMVSKPVSRATFLVARLAGTMLTLAVVLAAMGATFFLVLMLYGTRLHPTQFLAIGMLWMELLLLCSIGFLISSFSTPMISGLVTTCVFFAGHLSPDMYWAAERSKNLPLKYLGKAIYYVVPNLERFNYRPRATYFLTQPAGEVLLNIGYGLGYAIAATALAVIIFQRRDFK
ncbi:MAG: ABC transporter permease [Myxococcaceae bacterium]|nr:ABC transporter permease [Myxococcaceae bacterium]